MPVYEVGITVVRHQESKRCTLRLHLWYPKGRPIEPELIEALRGWDQVRPIDDSLRSAVGPLCDSRIFIDIAWANDLRPPYRQSRWREGAELTPDERVRHMAIYDRLWKLEQWLARWYGIDGERADEREESSLIVTHFYPEYAVHRVEPLARRTPSG